MNTCTRLAVAVLFALVLLPVLSSAQPAQVGNITGVVVDDTGACSPASP